MYFSANSSEQSIVEELTRRPGLTPSNYVRMALGGMPPISAGRPSAKQDAKREEWVKRKGFCYDGRDPSRLLTTITVENIVTWWHDGKYLNQQDLLWHDQTSIMISRARARGRREGDFVVVDNKNVPTPK
jgi:hypothetical protein